MAYNKVMLTIFLITYNHVKYIEKAIDSVLEQQTTYSYEIVIHDDCSNDGTREILYRYQKRYPEKITLILEEENMYSKNPSYIRRNSQDHFHGKYFIVLEGDDYWIDSSKIQKQVSFLERNNDIAGVAHASKHVIEGEKEWISPIDRKSGYYTIQELIDWKNVFHTASFMFRNEYYMQKPIELSNIKNGDWVNAVWLADKGKIYYMDDVMSVHRCFTEGSFSKNTFNDITDYKKIYEERQKNCDLLDSILNNKYHEYFVRSMNRRWFDFYYTNDRYKEAFSYSKAVFDEKMSLYIFFRCFMFAYAPNVISFIKKIRDVIR